MGTVIGEQALTLAAAVLLGAALALLYDLLRALRLRRRGSRALTAVLDTLYVAALAVSGLAFALRLGGGELRLYAIVFGLCGAWAYGALLSPVLRPLWNFWARTLFELLRLARAPFRALARWRRNLHKICKRLFLFYRRSYIIGSYGRYARRARHAAERREGLRYGIQAKTGTQKHRPSVGGADSAAAGAGGLADDGDTRQAGRRARRAGGAELAEVFRVIEPHRVRALKNGFDDDCGEFVLMLVQQRFH